MKKNVTIFLFLLSTSLSINAFAQSQQIGLKPDRVTVDPGNVFLAYPKYVKSFQPTQGHQNSPQSVSWIQYPDTVTKQFAYTFFPTILNVTQQNGTVIPDTVTGYSQRFTSPYTTNTYLDSVQVGIGIPTGALTSGANRFRLIIAAYTQTISTQNKLPFPGTLIDSTSVSYDDLAALTPGTLQFVTVKMKHKKVGRAFFITVSTPYDFSTDLASQQVIGIFGDSLDSPTAVDTAVQRGLASGFPYILYWSGITRPGGTPFYQNFFISALVNDQLAGVNDIKLKGNDLAQNFPNPFNPSTVIKYSLEKEEKVSIKLYNALGLEVASILDANEPAGENQVTFNGDNLPSGTYFYTMKAGTYSQTKRMVLAK